MPRLKQITCTVDWAETNVPFSEYGTVYGDGVVETYIAVPAKPQPFTIHLKSQGYIAEGLATLIYIDGEYQCNRNRVNLKPFKRDQSKAETEVDFRLRQKEKTIGDGQFLGRDWRFDCHNVVPADQGPSDFDATHFDQLGTIEVIVLRCRAWGLQRDDDATDSYTHDSILSKMRESRREETPDETSSANKAHETYQPTLEEEAVGGGMLGPFGVFDGAADEPDAPRRHHFGLDGEAPPNGYWTWTYQPPAPPSNFQPPQKRVHFDMGPPSAAPQAPPPQPQQQQLQQPHPQAQAFPLPHGQPAWHGQQAGLPQLQRGGPTWGGPAPTQRNISNESANTIPSSYFSQPQIQNQMPPQMQPQQTQQPFASQIPGEWAPPAPPAVPQNPWQAQSWPAQGYAGGGNWSAYPPWLGPSPYGYAPSYVPSPAMPQGSFVPQMQRPPQWQAQGPQSGWNMTTSPTDPPQLPGGWAGGPGAQQNKGGDRPLDSNQPVGQWGATNNQVGNWDANNNQSGNNWGGDGQQNNGGNSGWSGGDQNTQQDQPIDNNGGGGDNAWSSGQNDQTPQSNNNWDNNDNDDDDDDNNHHHQTQQSEAWGADQNNTAQQNNDNWASGNDNNNNNNARTTQWGGTGAAGPTTSGTRASRPLYGPYGAYYTTAPGSAALDSEAEAEEDPPYDVPETVATEKGTSHQVQPGKGYLYTHRRASPEYLDNIEEPYARFVFKYRTKEQIEPEIGISLPGEPTGDEEKQEYQRKSQDELIELLLRAKIALGGKIPSPPPGPVGAEEKQQPEAFNPVPVPAPKYDYLKYQLPESRKSSWNAGSGLGIAAPANDGWGNGGGGQLDNNNNNGGEGWGDNNNQQSNGNWDSGGGASGWDGPKNDPAANATDNPQAQQPQGGSGTQGAVLPPQTQAGSGAQGWESQQASTLTPAPPGGWTSGAAPNAGPVQHGGSGTWMQMQTQTQAPPQHEGWGASSGPDESTSTTANGWQSNQQQQQNQNQSAGRNTGGEGGWEAGAPAGAGW